MFKKNDKSLLFAKTLLTVACIMLAIFFLICGFMVASRTGGIGIGLILIGCIVIPITYILLLLRLNYYCDIKLIRNKLYELDNTNLEVFFKDNNNISNQ
ncbi:MAG: hypothetical protein E7364_02465 [Clostridiales bacterium]|nr:hypothetical protein [Clostridiales bacterium]MBQ3019468.1 hypothetical protein [Clostridia bacterium]